MSAQTISVATGAGDSDLIIISRDPATGAEIGRVVNTAAASVIEAVDHARAVQPEWARKSFTNRGAVVMRARQIVLDELEDIAQLISAESGKPVSEAISMELTPTLDLMQYYARNTARLLRPERINIGQYGLMGRSSEIVYKPLGVVGIISPWNFPWAIPLGEVVMALMAGNAVILKPSELTPLVAVRIGEVFKRAGLSEDLLQIITGDGKTGSALIDAGVDKIMFTGSVATGKRVAEAAAKHLTPCVLELGGKDPMIVLDDADVERAVSGAVWGGFANSGQACASVERCYVHESIAPLFTELLVKQVKDLRQDLGTKDSAEIGAMSSERQLSIVEEHVDDALKSGARALTGGRRNPEFDGPFFEPTVLVDVSQDMQVMREETFGPVLPVMTFKTDEEAIQLANDSDFGLTASVWTKNLHRGRSIAERIDAGTVTVNEVLYTHGIAQTPWGGVKQSGIGRTHGRLGLLELVSPRHIHVNRITAFRDLWWFNYTPLASKLFRGLARRFSTGNPLQTALLLPQMVRRLFEKRR